MSTHAHTLFLEKVAALVNLDEVRDDMTLAEIGIDSLNIVELILSAEELFQTNVDPASLELSGFTTVGDFLAMIAPTPQGTEPTPAQ